MPKMMLPDPRLLSDVTSLQIFDHMAYTGHNEDTHDGGLQSYLEYNAVKRCLW